MSELKHCLARKLNYNVKGASFAALVPSVIEKFQCIECDNSSQSYCPKTLAEQHDNE